MAVLPPDLFVRPAYARPAPTDPRRAYLAVAMAGLAMLAGAHAVFHPALPAVLWLPALAGYGAASVFVGAMLGRHFPHSELGWCNAVTQMRLALVALLVTPLLAQTGAGGWAVAGLAFAALALDGADGWLARRQDLCSAFGARFDMEVDAALALALALHALAAGAAGPAVIVLGLARYAFAAAGMAWPWLARPLPERFSRKSVCVAQLTVLIAVQVPWLPGPGAEALVALVAVALVWSFGRDIAWLRRVEARRGWA